jgi:hypothetical protein
MPSWTSLVRECGHALALFVLLACASLGRQTESNSLSHGENDLWQVPVSHDPVPHFERINGRQLLFVDGRPFTALAAEIPWWDLIYGRYKETEAAYDYLYPAAEKLGLNTLKVPVKWSMVEPEKGVYDFSYVDHAKALAEDHHLKLVLNWFGHYASGDGTIYANLTGNLYVPMYIVQDEQTYPRAVDGNGVVHHNVASYDYEPFIGREIAAFRAFLHHIKQVDSENHTIIMIQVENEIATFGADRKNPKLWRDHSTAANERYAERGFSDDLKFSAWDLSYNWIRPLTDAGAEIYPLPFFNNYVGGQIAAWMVGGAPGEDVEMYLKNCPHISFIGVNAYFCAAWLPDYSCGRESEATIDELREPLRRYRVGRNLPAITEINSGITPITARLAYIATGEFGVPIYAPWALTVSYPESNQPYVLSDGSLANGAYALRDAYTSLGKALPQISYYATTNKLKVFISRSPGLRFSETTNVNGFPVTVTGENDGQAIVIHPSGQEFLILGYRASVSFTDPTFQWPAMQDIRVERTRWSNNHWNPDGQPEYQVNQSNKTLRVDLDTPQAVRVSW